MSHSYDASYPVHLSCSPGPTSNYPSSFDHSMILHPQNRSLYCGLVSRSQVAQRDKKNPPSRDFIYALDHLSTKLKLPLSEVEETQAFKDDGLVPGLCRLYMEGRCRQGSLCFQVHARKEVVEKLRKEALSAPSCCYQHGAVCSYEDFPLGLTVTIERPQEAVVSHNEAQANPRELDPLDDPSTPLGPSVHVGSEKPLVINLHSLCPTNYLWRLYTAHGVMHVTVPIRKVCREHRKGLCRFGDECNFVHICREIPLGSLDEEGSHHTSSFPRGKNRSGCETMQGSFNVSNSMNNGTSIDEWAGIQSMSFGTPGCADSRAGLPGNSHNNPFGASFADGSMGSYGGIRRSSLPLAPSRSGDRSSLHQQEAERSTKRCLLRPLGNSASLTPLRQGSFSHNPYADASSLQ